MPEEYFRILIHCEAKGNLSLQYNIKKTDLDKKIASTYNVTFDLPYRYVVVVVISYCPWSCIM